VLEARAAGPWPTSPGLPALAAVPLSEALRGVLLACARGQEGRGALRLYLERVLFPLSRPPALRVLWGDEPGADWRAKGWVASLNYYGEPGKPANYLLPLTPTLRDCGPAGVPKEGPALFTFAARTGRGEQGEISVGAVVLEWREEGEG
jgi:hypothetical protein